MRKMLYVQYATMIIVCFISGVACYQLFELEQVQQVITWGDRRLLKLDKPSIFWSAVPIAIAIMIVLFFSTHRYLSGIAQVFVALKMTFLGFSSVYLLVQHNSIKLYSTWWFPFQLIYCILLVVICVNMAKPKIRQKGRTTNSNKRMMLNIAAVMIVFIVELFVISYVFI